MVAKLVTLVKPGKMAISSATAAPRTAFYVTCVTGNFMAFGPYLVAAYPITVRPPPAAEVGRICDDPVDRHLCGPCGLRGRPPRLAPASKPALEPRRTSAGGRGRPSAERADGRALARARGRGRARRGG